MATLTHDMLNDLHIGNAALSLMPYDPSVGVDITSGLDFSSADRIYTLEGTFNLTADDPSSSDIKVDQHGEVIDTKFETGGNWQMTGNIPTTAQAVLAYFFEEGSVIPAGTSGAVKGVKGADGDFYTGKGFLNQPKIVELTVLAESETHNTAILFPHVKMIVSPIKKDDNENPAYLSFLGYILPNAYKSGNDYVGDFAVLKAASIPT